MIVDALKDINLGTDEDLKPTYVNASLASDDERTYVDLFKEYYYVIVGVPKKCLL